MKNRLRFTTLISCLLAASFGLIILLCCFAAVRHRDIYHVPLLLNNSCSLNSGWLLLSPDGSEAETVTTPLELSYQDSDVHTLLLTLPEDQNFRVRPVVFFATNHMDIEAYVDGEKIYSYVSAKKGFSKSPGNQYHMIELPEDYAGRELKIELTMLLGESIRYTVPTPIMAVKATIVNLIFQKEITSIAILGFVFSFGIILLILSAIFQKIADHSKSLLFTGIFAILFSGYAFCETELIHFLISNSYMIYLCDLLFFALLPVPLLMILRDSVAERYIRLIDMCVALLFANFAVQTALNYLRILDLRESLISTHLLDLTGILLFIFCLFIRPDREKAARSHLRMAFSPVILGALIDLTMFYIPSLITENSFFFQIGVLMFLLIQLFFAVHSYLDLYVQKVQTDFYEKMAYTDALTNIGNRMAFNRELGRLNSETAGLGPIWCISADINNLKIVNDTYGHLKGDELIKGAANILSSVTPHAYRTGGDEFVLFLYQTEEKAWKEVLKTIEDKIKQYNEEHLIPLSIAIGSGRLEQEKESVTGLLIRTDKSMYERKAEMKG